MAAEEKNINDVIEHMMSKDPRYKYMGKLEVRAIVESYLRKTNKILLDGGSFTFPKHFGTMRIACRRQKPKEEPPFSEFGVSKKILRTLGYWFYLDVSGSCFTRDSGYSIKADKGLMKSFKIKLKDTDLFYELKID